MQMLIALLLLLTCSVVAPDPKQLTHQSHLLYLFTNDGTFYRMNAKSKEVDWYSSLNFKLITFEVDEDQNSTYFIPTIDGNFLYIDQNRQMLIDRQEVESLLDICFNGEVNNSSKYFVYEKFQYYVLNTANGNIQALQDFIKKKKVISQSEISSVILSISKKYLKEMSINLQAKWSAISSTINLMTAQQFFQKPNLKPKQISHHQFKFQRNGPKSINIIDFNNKIDFELESSSPILSIFSFNNQLNTFEAHKIQIHEKPKLAIGWVKQQPKIDNQSFVSSKIRQIYQQGKSKNQKTINFSDLDYFPIAQDSNEQKLIKTNIKGDKLLFCINSFRTISNIQNNKQKWIPKPPIIPVSYSRHQPIIQKQQPVAIILSGIILVIIIIFLYRIGIKQMLKQLSRVEQANDNKIQQLQKIINEHMGNAINRQDNNETSLHTIKWGMQLKKSEHYVLYNGTFINKQAHVYVINTNNSEHVQRQIEQLFKITASNMIKFYHVTPIEIKNAMKIQENIQSLAVFCQKNHIYLSTQSRNKAVANCRPQQLIKSLIATIMSINQRLKVRRLCFQSIIVQQNGFKIDPLPNLLPITITNYRKKSYQQNQERKNNGDQIKQVIQMFKLIEVRNQKVKVTNLQVDLVNIIYFIQKGQHFNEKILSDQEKDKQVNGNQQNLQSEFLLRDCLEQIIFQQPQSQVCSILESINEHPFLWDTKQKMLFILDFSNYLQTHTDQNKISKLQSKAKQLEIIKIPWVKQLHPSFVIIQQQQTKQINSHRKYDYSSIRDLIRVVRNKVSHFHQLPKEIRQNLGKNPQEFVQYFLIRFPKLLPFMYAYSKKKKWKLHSL